MPSSVAEGKGWTAAMLERLAKLTPIRSVVDIGAGCGTYAAMRDSAPEAKWTAVEIWEPYVAQFDLWSKYDEIVLADARTMDWTDYDFAFCGDVLEHMNAEDAMALWDQVLEHCRFAVISIPVVHYPQGEYEGNPFEAHVVDDWSHERVLECFPGVRVHEVYSTVGVYFAASSDIDAQLLYACS